MRRNRTVQALSTPAKHRIGTHWNRIGAGLKPDKIRQPSQPLGCRPPRDYIHPQPPAAIANRLPEATGQKMAASIAPTVEIFFIRNPPQPLRMGKGQTNGIFTTSARTGFSRITTAICVPALAYSGCTYPNPKPTFMQGDIVPEVTWPIGVPSAAAIA